MKIELTMTLDIPDLDGATKEVVKQRIADGLVGFAVEQHRFLAKTFLTHGHLALCRIHEKWADTIEKAEYKLVLL